MQTAATLETIIPYLLRPKTTHDAVATLRASWVDVPKGLLDRPTHASMKLRLDCVKAHTHRFAEVYSYAVASSYRLPNGKKLVQKGQDMRLFISPKHLRGSQKEEAALSVAWLLFATPN